MGASLIVIGAGLAGSEAALQAANLGVRVDVYDLKPQTMTPAHSNPNYAELVCSNSLRGAGRESAVGLLKDELRRLGSYLMDIADRTAVPAGGALAVDRELFAAEVTAALRRHPRIICHSRRICSLDEIDGPRIVATGPLTGEELYADLQQRLGQESLYYFDAMTPLVAADSLDMDELHFASRYGKGSGKDYLNAYLSREEYYDFVRMLTEGERVIRRDFEPGEIFEGCVPIEEIARRGPESLRYGPLKPTGLRDPRTGRRPFACVQLRRDDRQAETYNLVGFQTNLTFTAQREIFGKIPGLRRVKFIRYGVMHRNTYINSARTLNTALQWKDNPEIFFAGQIAGLEGYVEAIAGGLLAGVNAAAMISGEQMVMPSPRSILGGLVRAITTPVPDPQPVQSNWGLQIPFRTARRDPRRNLSQMESAMEIMPWREMLQSRRRRVLLATN